MEKFEFTSQICTTKEQSQKLLQLGLKESTADCALHYDFVGMDGEVYYLAYQIGHKCSGIPAWSLYRLLMMYGDNYSFFSLDNAYGELIHAIAIDIEKGTFNPEYLEEQKCEK